MMYSRSMIGLTLVSMIGLALPSSVMTQRKIAKGSKKNPPPSSQQDETEIPVELVAPLAMTMPELEAAVTKAVLDILEELQEPDNERRNLQFNGSDESALGAVQITGTTKTKCPEQYLTDEVACYDAIIMIGSKEDLMERIQKLQAALNVVISIENGSIAVTQQTRGGYPYVKLKNTTPYPVPHGTEESWGTFPRAAVRLGPFFCSDDLIMEGIASGETWSQTSRGICNVYKISAYLTVPDGKGTYGGSALTCTSYLANWGTSYSKFSIIMKGDNACCVQSSHESGVCP